MSERRRGGLPVNEQQEEIVRSVLDNRLTVASAGAGSGKTHLTVAATLEVIEQGRGDLDQFVLITFTEKAAGHLRRKLEEGLADLVAKAVGERRRFWLEQRERLGRAYTGTIHGFCREQLARFGYDEGVARQADVTFASTLRFESATEVVEALLHDPADPLLDGSLTWQGYDLRSLLLDLQEEVRNLGLNSLEVRERTAKQPADPGRAYRLALADLLVRADQRYAERKKEDNVLDPNDLLARMVSLLQGPGRGDVLRRLGQRYRFLFVDEFQDTDRRQKAIIDALLPYLERVLVVGDPKQSIYGFRGAVSLLRQLAQENGVRLWPLSISRRPTRPLLRVQTALFGSVGTRFPELNEPLVPWEKSHAPADTLPPLCYLDAGRQGGREGQLRLTAGHIRHLLGCRMDVPGAGLRPVEPGDIAILMRSNARLEEYAEGLRGILGDEVAVRLEAGGLFYRREEVVSTYRMLHLLLRYPDDSVLLEALGTPYLSGLAGGAPVADLLQEGPQPGGRLTDWLEAAHPEVCRTLGELRQAVRLATAPQLLGLLYERFAIREHYAARGDRQALDNLEKLRQRARALFRNEQALTLHQYVRFLRTAILHGLPESDADPADGDAARPPYVRLMSIHRAKGLEFPIVILPEMQARLLHPPGVPSVRVLPRRGLDAWLPARDRTPTNLPLSAEEEQDLQAALLEEEMRLFYVAVTRAQHAVTLIGQGGWRSPQEPVAPWYSWKDEVLRARPRLERLGARFVFEGD